MSLTATYTAIQTLNATVTGIVSAPTELPASLDDSRLPCALCFPGPAEWNEQAQGLKRWRRQYFVKVYVLPIVQGAGIDTGFQKAITILQAMGTAYLDDPTLSDSIDHMGNPGAAYFTDNGIETLTFAGVAYHGFTLRLDITEKTT